MRGTYSGKTRRILWSLLATALVLGLIFGIVWLKNDFGTISYMASPTWAPEAEEIAEQDMMDSRTIVSAPPAAPVEPLTQGESDPDADLYADSEVSEAADSQEGMMALQEGDENTIFFVPGGADVTENVDTDGGMSTTPELALMANATHTIDVTDSTSVANSISAGSIPGVSIADNILTFDSSVDSADAYILSGTTATVRIIAATGTTVNITLNGASITHSTVSPFQLSGTANVTLTLAAGTTNTLTCMATQQNSTYSTAGLAVTTNASITIYGTGTLNATGGYAGAGIGGYSYMSSAPDTAALNCGKITINSGNIIAQGGVWHAAGIGSGDAYSSMSGAVVNTTMNITINGGTVNATGGDAGGSWIGAPGIGGGGSTTGTITITGGTVTATGGAGRVSPSYESGVGIGGARTCNTTVSISGGTITATAGEIGTGNVGIGNGMSTGTTSSCTVTITSGRVTAIAKGTDNSPGIGCKNGGTRGTTVITGGSVYPIDSSGGVSIVPLPTNSRPYGLNTVSMVTFPGHSDGGAFSIEAGGTTRCYSYAANAHPDGNVYAWLAYPAAATEAATNIHTAPASVTAPTTASSPSSSTATLNGTYYLNNTVAVERAYFEYGTTTAYGSTQAVTPVGTIAPSAEPALTTLAGLAPGTTYHYCFVIEVPSGEIISGSDMTFTTPVLAPSVDTSYDYVGGTDATLYGIYDLNGGTFVSGQFEISTDDGITWSAVAGGTLSGTTATPSVSLTGLSAGVTYKYRLTVTNSIGTATATGSFQLVNYTITEKYVDQLGNPMFGSSVGSLPSVAIPDTIKSVFLMGTYNGTAAAIPGYMCVRYYIGSATDTFATATPGTSGDTAPAISNVAADYTVWFVYDNGRIDLVIDPEISYGTQQITPTAEKYPAKIFTLQVDDNRYYKDKWKINAKLVSPFTHGFSSETLTDALLYSSGGALTALDTANAVQIYEEAMPSSTLTPQNTDIYDTWYQGTENAGLFVQASPSQLKLGTYTAEIEWTLIDAY